MGFQFLADTTVVLHFVFVLFAVFGGLLVAWRPWVAWVHLPAAGWQLFPGRTELRARADRRPAGALPGCGPNGSTRTLPRTPLEIPPRKEYVRLRPRDFPRLMELVGEEAANRGVENWSATVVVCKKGEMLRVYRRARSPAREATP